MPNPKISVLMPVYNAERYIRDAIESVLKQTFSDFEILIVNDASTDASQTIAHEYARKDNRIRVIHNRLSKGIVGALNTGLAEARGTYIARADADDNNRPDRLMLQYEYLANHPDLYIIGGAYAVHKENTYVRTIYHPASSIAVTWTSLTDSRFCHPTVMFRREILDTVGNYPDEEAEDFAFFSKVLQKFKGGNLRHVLIDYREHVANRSLLYKEHIEQSTKNIFTDTYKYWTGTTEWMGVFYAFHHDGRLRVRHAYTIVRISLQILKRIRTQYGTAWYSLQYIRNVGKMFWDIFRAILHS